MKQPLLSIISALSLLPIHAADGLPTLQRSTLDKETLWQLETELTGYLERNGAVSECTASALNEQLLLAGCEATVENLVQVLTTPSEAGTPQSAIKELLLPKSDVIRVGQDGSFAVISTPTAGGEIVEIFRDTPFGISVQRLLR